MWHLAVCVVLAGLLAWPQSVAAQAGEEAPANPGLAIHVQHHLPPQLMLRASYYLYLDTDADTDATSDQSEPNAEKPVSESVPEKPALELKLDHAGVEVAPTAHPTAGESKQATNRNGRAIGIGVGVTVAIVLAVGVGVGVSVSKIKHMAFF